MNVSQLVGEDKPVQTRKPQQSIEGHDNIQQRQSWPNNVSDASNEVGNGNVGHSPQRPVLTHSLDQSGSSCSPAASNLPPKHVTFEYLLPENPQQRARLPMRVNIYPHDAMESIITTVRNFYGLYENSGVSFQDKDGVTLIAKYENLQDKMTVYVRVTDTLASNPGTPRTSVSPRRPRLGAPFEAFPPHHISRPTSQNAHHNRSISPHNNRGRRSASVSIGPKARSRPGTKGRTGSTTGSFADHHGDAAQDYSDSDGGNGSVTSSRRDGNVVASAEISVDNIVEGGRRKRARFDSSELPLFVPSQVPMPNSVSSISPQRRIASNPSAVSPYQQSNQYTFSYQHPTASPQSHGYSDMSYMGNGANSAANINAQAMNNRALRARPATYAPPRYATGAGVLPTPDPTIGSVISDEDVALQLMRLGDASNLSLHGRTSTSTVDDAYSGKAEVSEESDGGGDVDVNVDVRMAGYASDEYSGEEYEDRQDVSFKGESDGILPEDIARMRRAPSKAKSHGGTGVKDRVPSLSTKLSKSAGGKIKAKAKSEHGHGSKGPISPMSLPTQSRKTSNASLLQFGPDEDDLSTKPRCQRCRKSKKGCDRQRPCGRCKDAGIGIDGCVSEDEGNGRKGRYGRHMGVPVKKDEHGMPIEIQPSPVANHHVHTSMAPPPLVGMKGGGQKRKRQ